jgi:succinate dehydrogenase/fumarate reductase flavoprotein subunit
MSAQSNQLLDVDLLVIGGGMAGMTAAGYAAKQGRRVLVLEKGPAVGGSAGLSEGYVWTAPTLEALQLEDPRGNHELAGVVVAELAAGLDWVESLGVHVGAPLTEVLGFGAGRQIDVWEFMRACSALVEASGGFVVTGAEVQELLAGGSGIVGARVAQDGEVEIGAAATLLATGGFQGSRELVRQHIRPEWEDVIVRSNQESRGDGLRLGLAAGAAASEDMRGFYGHLMPWPLDRELTHSDYTGLAQYHSEHGLLLNERGERFVDESLGDHWCNEAVAAEPHVRALLLCDERIRREEVMKPFVPGMQQGLDKFKDAGDAGAHYVEAATLEGLAPSLREWGYDDARAAATVREFNELVARAPETLAPGRRRLRRPVDAAPFIALEVQPAITFTYGGLVTDDVGRVLRSDGSAIGGLFAAGADQGGVYHRGYAGGLSRALVFGLRAARTATGSL